MAKPPVIVLPQTGRTVVLDANRRVRAAAQDAGRTPMPVMQRVDAQVGIAGPGH